MKKISFLLSLMLLAILFITSCKDNQELSSRRDMVLIKIFRDGKLHLEYRHNTSKQLEQIRELVNGEEAGLLYTDLDSSGGQNSSPVYSFLTPSHRKGEGIIRRVSEVLIGTLAESCQQIKCGWQG